MADLTVEGLISHTASLLFSLYLLFAEAPLPIPSAGRKDEHGRTHAIILPQHIHHPSYLHDRNYWFSYYITTGQWFMSCWSHRADGWYALYPWPSWIAASPADFSIGKHTPTRARSVQSKPTTYYTSRPKNNTQAICKFSACWRDRCVGDRKREERMSRGNQRGRRENVLSSIFSITSVSTAAVTGSWRCSIGGPLVDRDEYVKESKKKKCIKQWEEGKWQKKCELIIN